MKFMAMNHRAARRKAPALALMFVGLGVVQTSAWSAKEPELVGGPATMRRLTESQYRATRRRHFRTGHCGGGSFRARVAHRWSDCDRHLEAGMSSFSVEQYDASARGIAKEVVSKERRDKLVPCTPKAESEFDEACAKRFVEHYGTLLFRRPLSSPETKRFVETARSGHEGLGNFYSGLEFALAGMMVQPDFLLRIERVGARSEAQGSGAPRCLFESDAAQLLPDQLDTGQRIAAGRGRRASWTRRRAWRARRTACWRARATRARCARSSRTCCSSRCSRTSPRIPSSIRSTTRWWRRMRRNRRCGRSPII